MTVLTIFFHSASLNSSVSDTGCLFFTQLVRKQVLTVIHQNAFPKSRKTAAVVRDQQWTGMSLWRFSCADRNRDFLNRKYRAISSPKELQAGHFCPLLEAVSAIVSFNNMKKRLQGHKVALTYGSCHLSLLITSNLTWHHLSLSNASSDVFFVASKHGVFRTSYLYLQSLHKNKTGAVPSFCI